MARKGSGLRTVVKIAKAIDRANKKAVRQAEQRRKEHLREEARRQREYEKMLRQQEKEATTREKERIAYEKAQFKLSLEQAKSAYDGRCKNRENLRNEYINKEVR